MYATYLSGYSGICSLWGMIGVQYVLCDPLKKNPAHPTKMDLHVHVVLEAIIVTKETF